MDEDTVLAIIVISYVALLTVICLVAAWRNIETDSDEESSLDADLI